ncbi:zf-TFIIB domain-containing protein [Stenotrophomonas rhizophila]|uniref:TFIIB-type zinc ribbon-containing protein n=1 Tax=Stenotrophomonas rhizophila TaxID=216778 RepID=UPI001E5C522D|nr:zf-TFIIB domain-containing protein [Stenotrophomonas rhizophila]MCC7632604.1 zf-TFIIB domain-containing protein [Stenotrophomonas rhizophila]MCC7663456.1 zf-TFIIB domain-containing protein [Stenotrophomonas rhizophila]
MQCPVCKTQALVMSERQGIEIDYCPQCRGVWLDRGELDKIIERSVGTAAPAEPVRAAAPPPSQHRDTRHLGQQQPYGDQQGYRKKKKESFLSDLFDF